MVDKLIFWNKKFKNKILLKIIGLVVDGGIILLMFYYYRYLREWLIILKFVILVIF